MAFSGCFNKDMVHDLLKFVILREGRKFKEVTDLLSDPAFPFLRFNPRSYVLKSPIDSEHTNPRLSTGDPQRPHQGPNHNLQAFQTRPAGLPTATPRPSNSDPQAFPNAIPGLPTKTPRPSNF